MAREAARIFLTNLHSFFIVLIDNLFCYMQRESIAMRINKNFDTSEPIEIEFSNSEEVFKALKVFFRKSGKLLFADVNISMELKSPFYFQLSDKNDILISNDSGERIIAIDVYQITEAFMSGIKTSKDTLLEEITMEWNFNGQEKTRSVLKFVLNAPIYLSDIH